MDGPADPSGTLILRVWVEEGRPDRFRARMLRTVGLRQASPVAASTVDEVIMAVRAWIDELLEPGA